MSLEGHPSWLEVLLAVRQEQHPHRYGVEDGIVMVPYHLISLLKLIPTHSEILPILCHCMDSLFMLLAHSVELLLHVCEP